MSVDLCVRIIVRPCASLHLRTFGGHTHASSVCEQEVGGAISFYVSVSSCLYHMPSSHRRMSIPAVGVDSWVTLRRLTKVHWMR